MLGLLKHDVLMTSQNSFSIAHCSLILCQPVISDSFVDEGGDLAIRVGGRHDGRDRLPGPQR